MNIDWSKAPEGATHSDGKIFYRFITGKWEFYCGGEWASSKDWSHTTGIPDSFVGKNVGWDGNGVPQVGTMCEYYVRIFIHEFWCRACVEFVGSHFIVVKYKHPELDDQEACIKYRDVVPELGNILRPIHRIDKIAARKYERDAEALAEILNMKDAPDSISLAKLILDCGYRK
jgi:hypothetical protein